MLDILMGLDELIQQEFEISLEELEEFVHDWGVNPPQSCSGCHR